MGLSFLPPTKSFFNAAAACQDEAEASAEEEPHMFFVELSGVLRGVL